MVTNNYSSIEADWIRFYNRSLQNDLWGKEKISIRKIFNLLKWLPPDAAIWRSNKTAWTNTDELLATLIEVNDAQLRVFIQANSKPNSKKLEPIVIERPNGTNAKQSKKRTSLKEIINTGNIPVRKTDIGGE